METNTNNKLEAEYNAIMNKMNEILASGQMTDADRDLVNYLSNQLSLVANQIKHSK